MRKHDRAINDFEEIKALVDSCDTLRLALSDRDAPYIVPLSFGFKAENGVFTFYVHGAKSGRRHELAEKCARVCVETDICRSFVELEGGAQTADYKSFIGWGEISTVSGEETVTGLELLCRHCGFDAPACSKAVIDMTCVEKIVVHEFTAKQRFK